MVLKEIKASIQDPRGKFQPNWIGSLIMITILSKEAIALANLDGRGI